MEKVFRIPEDGELPLVGCITFGLIDRGTNLIQTRPISGCNLNCILCSVDEGPNTKMHATSYVVNLEYLMEWFKQLAKLKGENVEAHIDGCGEPMLYKNFVELVSSLSDVKEVKTISVQTNGTLLDEKKIDELAEAGLNRINLSINAMDAELAKKLSGSENYDIERIIEIARYIAKSKIELLIAPVYIAGLNESEMPKIIKFAKGLGCGRMWPSLGIQNFEAHRFGRKPTKKKLTWWKFYRALDQWEKQFGIKLKLTIKDFGIHKAPSLQTLFERGEKIRVEVKAPGWMKNEMIAVAKDRCITVVDCDNDINDEIKIKILQNKHNIYIAEKVK